MLDVPGQMSIDDAAGSDLEQLGDLPEFGWVILELLDQNGWSVHVRAPFAGAIDDEGTPGVMILAAHRYADIPDLRIVGRTVADCAPQLMVEAGKYVPAIARARERLNAKSEDDPRP